MSGKTNRILMYGAGVIGSLYAVKFAEAGLDIALLARGNRLQTLRERGLQYHENGNIKRIDMKVIEKLEQDDRYDFIFVPVRYDQAESALLALKDNPSPNIVTMTNNSTGYSSWVNIVGERLLPAFPSAGGEMKNGVLYAQFGPRALQATTFGEINRQVTTRVKELEKLFRRAKIASTISKDITAFQITHAAWVTALNKSLYTEDGIMDQATAVSTTTVRSMALTIKAYLRSVEKAGIRITPSMLKLVLHCPDWLVEMVLRKLLNTKLAADVLLGGHASVVRPETQMLDRDFIDFLKRNNVSPG